MADPSQAATAAATATTTTEGSTCTNSNDEAPIYLTTVSAPTNIAVIKYWGKADVTLNTPINSSLSVTLNMADDLRAVTTVAASAGFTDDRLWLNGVEDVKVSSNTRFRACVDQVKALATDRVVDGNNVVVSKGDWQQWHVHVSSYNTFPTAAGLASSAAGYAALVAALAHLYQAQEAYEFQLSAIARQGSGSACRSLYGGLVAWNAGSATNDWRDSMAEPIASHTSWPALKTLILVVQQAQKDVSSTAGMMDSVKTSPLLAYRAEHVVPARMTAMKQAWHDHDFATFGKICMQDSNQFHATCLDTYPPIFYLNDVSRQIIRLVTMYNAYHDEIRAAYTFDAGPNAVLYVLQPHLPELGALMLYYFPNSSSKNDNRPYYVNNVTAERQFRRQALPPGLLKRCDQIRAPRPGDVQLMYVTGPGPGPQVLSDVFNLDPHTGLNTYQR